MARRIDTGQLVPARTPRADPTANADVLQILLVDDRPENLSALEAVLAPLGLPLVTASSGTQALRLLLENDFAAILLDVRMPGMDGIETARLIKSRERTRDIPILFLTAAQDDVQEIARGYKAGAVDYVLKPFDPVLLRSKVEIFIELQESRRALQRSEALLRGAFEFAPIGKTVLDSGLRIVRANPAFARLIGREPLELANVEIAELGHPEDRETLVGALRAVEHGDREVAAPEGGGIDLRLQTHTGGEVWVALVASSIERTELAEPSLLAQWVDLSVRRRAEEARAQLLLEQSARTHAEEMAERLSKLQALTDALDSLALDRLLDELALRIAELFGADASEVRVSEGAEREAIVRVAGGRVLDPQDEVGWPRSGDWLRAPMRIERLGVGMVALHAPPERSFTAAEEALLHDAADRAALAIHQALLFEAEHRTAVELQRGLLPKHLPQIEGLRLAAHYEAAGAAAEVGGDWYDAFALSGARVGIVVGDVAGRGIPAASTMGQLRSVTRALAIQDRQQRLPGEVLTRLNRYQLAIDEVQFVTVLYAIIDSQDATVVFASAGHLPPLLRSASGDCRYLRGGGYPLGTEDVEYDDTTEHLHLGDALILYTDGLVERRGEAIDAGLERLAQAVRDGPREPQELCEHLFADALPHPEELYDDVTALVAELGPAPEVSRAD